jgi:hypothetical protein
LKHKPAKTGGAYAQTFENQIWYLAGKKPTRVGKRKYSAPTGDGRIDDGKVSIEEWEDVRFGFSYGRQK